MFGPKVALLGGNVIVLEKGGISWGECVLFGSQRCTLGGKSGLSGRKRPSLGRRCPLLDGKVVLVGEAVQCLGPR